MFQARFSPHCCCCPRCPPSCPPPLRCRDICSTHPPANQDCTMVVKQSIHYSKEKPLQRRAAWADNRCRSLVEVHCPRKTSSLDNSPSLRTEVPWRPWFGTTVPTLWRWHRHPALVPPTRKAPWHRGTWTSSCHHGYDCSSLKEKGQRPPRSRGTRSTTRRGCQGRRSCCARRWCGGRSRWRARSHDPDFGTCSDSCSVSPRPRCCTGLHCCYAGDFSEPRLHLLVVLSSSELCLVQCHSPPRHPPTVGQQGGSDCALRGELGCGQPGGRNPSLKASLVGEVAAAKAPAHISA